MFTLDYLHSIVIENVPLQWMTRVELFSSDLEQFPLMYVHVLTDSQSEMQIIGDYNLENKQRIFGFGLAASWSDKKSNGLCDVTISFACNIPQNYHFEFDRVVLEELRHRIGYADKVSFDDLEVICSNSPETLPLLQKIWKDKLEVIYGEYIPHGKIYEELYGIIRFSASGNAPRLGKISEYRMLYWYLQDLGEKVNFCGSLEDYQFLEAYLLPTYEELRCEDLAYFPKFRKFFISTKRFWDAEYTGTFTINDNKFRYAPKESLPIKSADFEKRYVSLLGEDYDNISRLRQIFNRMPSRLYGYIWNLMTSTKTDYKVAFEDKDVFKEFYRDYAGKKGMSAKVIACFLQQSFGLEAFPIDTWVQTFIYYPLGMDSEHKGTSDPAKEIQNSLYSKYSRLDKLEKIIWASSMGNKTNKTEFMDILWCQRYGTDKGSSGPCRGPNPLSCKNCILREECLSYKAIRDQSVYISDNKNTMEEKIKENSCAFGIHSDSGTPRRVYDLIKNKAVERDSHSGLDLSSQLSLSEGIYTVDQIIEAL